MSCARTPCAPTPCAHARQRWALLFGLLVVLWLTL